MGEIHEEMYDWCWHYDQGVFYYIRKMNKKIRRLSAVSSSGRLRWPRRALAPRLAFRRAVKRVVPAPGTISLGRSYGGSSVCAP